MKKRKEISVRKNKNNVNIKESMNKRVRVIKVVIYSCFFLLMTYVSYLTIVERTHYTTLLNQMTSNVYYEHSVPRGRIYDRNYRLLVDNQEVATISYLKPEKIQSKEELEMSLALAEYLEVDISSLTVRMLKDYWLVENKEEATQLIHEAEWEKYENRKLNSNDIYYLQLSRIDESIFENYSPLQKESAYIYYLMNHGYSYEEKSIKKEVTDVELSLVSEHLKELPGISIAYDWKRVYPYGEVFRSILGNISSISKEEKNDYLAQGYSLNDIVGISYLEKQYESFLKGEKGTYTVQNGERVELSRGSRGNDIVLTIDIVLQQEVEKILEEEIIKTKSEPSTSLFNHAYVVIKDPNNGEILAMAGKEVRKQNGVYQAYDVTPGVLTNAVTPGSVVKGASMLVGYNEGAISIGEYQKDECIKLYSKPKKCSWSNLGRINDLTALALSSNVYQFKTAMKVAGYQYQYNGNFTDTEKAFSLYRKTFREFGLGVKSEIDLPVDGIGNVGVDNAPDLLLNYVIGQYDTYTTMQLSDYISTVATGGMRYQSHLLKEVHRSDNKEELGSLLYTFKPRVLNTVTTKPEYIERVQLGFREVLSTGLGKGYMGNVPNPAGKTGTSESFLDTNGDGVIDTPTLSNAFVGYYPFEKPKMSIAITFPNLVSSSGSNQRSYANKRITKLISNKFFDLYG